MTKQKRGMDDAPDISRPPNFPIPKGPIVFGQVYACSICGGSGRNVKSKKKPCTRCDGQGWFKKGDVLDG